VNDLRCSVRQADGFDHVRRERGLMIQMLSLVPNTDVSTQCVLGAEPTRASNLGAMAHPPSSWPISILRGHVLASTVVGLSNESARLRMTDGRDNFRSGGPSRSQPLQYTSPTIARTRCLLGVVGNGADDEMQAPVIALSKGL
jgi:hypothetical protein